MTRREIDKRCERGEVSFHPPCFAIPRLASPHELWKILRPSTRNVRARQRIGRHSYDSHFYPIRKQACCDRPHFSQRINQAVPNMYQGDNIVLWTTLVILVTLLTVGESRRGNKHSSFESELEDDSVTSPKVKIPWHKYAKMASTYSKNSLSEEESSYCHKVALKRCGNSFMKVFQLFTFLPEEQSFQAKCASRTAFYSCLKKFSSRPCMSSWHFHIEEKFRKRLADNLWSARTCVLGIVPPHSHSSHNGKH